MKKVAIIGGGIAGLTCAYRLAQKGVDCVLFDETAYTGGRIEYCVSITTRRFQPRFYNLVKELGLEEAKVAFPPTELGMLVQGEIKHYEDLPKMIEELSPKEKNYWNKVMKDAMESSFDVFEPSPRLLEVRKMSFADYLKDCPPRLLGMMIKPMMGFTFMEELDLDKFSADWGLSQIRFGMEMMEDAHTFEENVKIVANVLERKIRDGGSEVYLSCPVTKVKKIDRGFKVDFERQGEADSIKAEKVVLATPLNATHRIFPELNLGEDVFYEDTKCILVRGELKTKRSVIMGVPGDKDNIRLLFKAYPHEHQLYPLKEQEPINFEAIYKNYKVVGEKKLEVAYPLLRPNGKAPGIATNIKGAYLCGDFYYYPLLDTAVRTAEKAADLVESAF